VAVPMVGAALVTALVFFQVDASARSDRELAFQQETQTYAFRLRERLRVTMETLTALERFAALSGSLEREQFSAFVRPFLNEYEGTQNFTYNPLVQHAQRESFEADARQWYDRRVSILDRDDTAGNDRTRTAETREWYLPILFVEPLESNEAVVGLDPRSIPESRTAIERSIETGNPAATAPLTLTQEPSDQRGVVVYYVLQTNPETNSGISASGFPSHGMVTVAFRMEEMLSPITAQLRERSISMCLTDSSSIGPDRPLVGSGTCRFNRESDSEIARTETFEFGGRQWKAEFYPLSDYEGVGAAVPPWIIAILAMALTGSLGGFLLLFSGQARRIATLVDEKTGELSNLNRDLTFQKQALAEAQSIARLGNWKFYSKSRTFEFSEELSRLLGTYPRTSFSWSELLGLVHQTDQKPLVGAARRSRASGEKEELDCRVQSDPPMIMHVIIEPAPSDSSEPAMRGTAQDVTATRNAASRIERLAHYDALTGLPNRVLWRAHVETILDASRRHNDTVAILFLDFDDFKTINDSLGHDAGDRLLKLLADRMRHLVRRHDIVARLGGDEFVLCLSRLRSREDIARVATHLRDSLALPLTLDNQDLRLSVSIGIALVPEDGTTVDELLQHADTAMYKAKSAGRNALRFFEPAMDAEAKERLTLENGMRQGINRGEFFNDYQRQVDARTGASIGVEALLRWNHRANGSIAPTTFIPVAEQSGLIVPLGEHALRHACLQQARWQNTRNRDFNVSVNISALQLRREDFSSRLQSMLAETGANPERLKLEITESTLVNINEDLLSRMRELQSLGITFSLDDFGTGYSSLVYLKRLPISQIKLDKSFVSDVAHNPDAATIVETAIAMGANLRLEVIAEGVETTEQRDFLMRSGCPLMQGFLFGKPEPPSAL
ncbi:MAG: EAL domain-containing protein, partial [Spirochaetales bacterium]